MMNRWAVIITDQRLFPPWGGNRVRILGIIRTLRDLGWRVALVTNNSNSAPELRALVDRIVRVRAQSFLGGDISAFDVSSFRPVLAEVTRSLRAALVIAEYAWLAPALLSVPAAVVRCVDCHDLLSERTDRFRRAQRDPWVICTPAQERRLLNCADVLIAIQYRDQEMLRRLVPGKKVVCLLPHIDLPPNFQRGSADTSIVLSLGANHAGNEGIRRFAASHWPNVFRQDHRARLHIVGRIGAGVASSAGIKVFGPVDDLYAHYSAAAIVLCPIDVGTGAKIKMLEALRFGKAIVATSAAAEGLPVSQNQAWITEDSWPACADAIVRLLTDPGMRKQLEDAAFAYGERYLTREHFHSQIRAILPSRVKQLYAAWAT